MSRRTSAGDGFSISPLELPLRPGVFIAKPQPFRGDFGIFEGSLPDGYGRYLLHKALMRKGINDSDLSSLDRLQETELEVLKEQQDTTPVFCSTIAETVEELGQKP